MGVRERGKRWDGERGNTDGGGMWGPEGTDGGGMEARGNGWRRDGGQRERMDAGWRPEGTDGGGMGARGNGWRRDGGE
jgi:hypothetical protein